MELHPHLFFLHQQRFDSRPRRKPGFSMHPPTSSNVACLSPPTVCYLIVVSILQHLVLFSVPSPATGNWGKSTNKTTIKTTIHGLVRCQLQATFPRPALELEMRAASPMVDTELDHTRHPWIVAAPVATVAVVCARRGCEV
jgi:hypothetical protein